MDPAELKKLRNKQKKAKRKAEQEKQQQQQLQARKELHNKSQRKNDDELDSPAKDELLPEKLERPDDPLAEAVKFLQPLQQLAHKEIATHATAFEIYYRKGRSLLMLQSVKRALSVAAAGSDPRVHGCVIRLQKFVEDKSEGFSEPVRAVIDRETKGIFDKDKSARQRNEEFMQNNKDSLHAAFIGKIHSRLGRLTFSKVSFVFCSRLQDAVTHRPAVDRELTSKHHQAGRLHQGRQHQGEWEYYTCGFISRMLVIHWFFCLLQTCSEILDSLAAGDFGAAGKAAADAFRAECAKVFPHAVKFRSETTKL